MKEKKAQERETIEKPRKNEGLDASGPPIFWATGSAAGRVGRGNSKSIFTANPPKISQVVAVRAREPRSAKSLEN